MRRLWTFVTLYFYLKCAWTNPGFLQGSAEDEAAKAGAYNPKLYKLDGEPSEPKTQDIEMMDNSAIGDYQLKRHKR